MNYADLFPDAEDEDFEGEESEVINKVAERTGRSPEEVRQMIADAE